MTERTFERWAAPPPQVAVVLPKPDAPGRSDGAFWCTLLEAWGIPSRHLDPEAIDATDVTTLVVPAASVDASLLDSIGPEARSRTVLVVGTDGAPAVSIDGPTIRFGPSAEDLDAGTTEDVVDTAERALLEASPAGLVGLWRWPDAKSAALVVDGDVDHPTGIDPECSRYVAPAIETARRAGFDAYGIFVAAANVDAEPSSFPSGAEYYNHTYSHPYSHWNDSTWESLDDESMEHEITRSEATLRSRLGSGDHGLFRIPHFQLEACDRTYDVLERLGYRAESSAGANHTITGGLPYHPAREPWSERPSDAAHLRSDPERERRRGLLQLPISTDPTDPAFPNGCCSYNTLGEGVRSRTSDPDEYGRVLDSVLDRAIARNSLAHLFIDPPDMGFGRLPGDRPEYAAPVERWLRRAVGMPNLAILSTAGLADWWLAREATLERMRWRVDGALTVRLEDPPPGATLAILAPGDRSWTLEPLSKRTA